MNHKKRKASCTGKCKCNLGDFKKKKEIKCPKKWVADFFCQLCYIRPYKKIEINFPVSIDLLCEPLLHKCKFGVRFPQLFEVLSVFCEWYHNLWKKEKVFSIYLLK